MLLRPLVDPEEETMTREEFHRLRDGPTTNGDGPACETCGGPLAKRQKRFCSMPCCAAGARQEKGRRPDSEAVGSLVAQLLGVGGIGEIEVQFAGVHLTVRTKEA